MKISNSHKIIRLVTLEFISLKNYKSTILYIKYNLIFFSID